MNNIDKQYQLLLQDVLDNGISKSDRTGTGTISVFGRQIRHKMSEGFPLLTTKKMAWKQIVTELLWFLRGDTNIKFLLDYDCHIWDGDAYKNYEKWQSTAITPQGPTPKLSKEDFIKAIKINDTFAKRFGELGPIYGKQWRSWTKKEFRSLNDGHFGYTYDDKPIDQIQNLINELKTNPDSRRLMVSAWNVAELDQMVLPPCHYGFQVYTRELNINERGEVFRKTYPDKSVDDFAPGGMEVQSMRHQLDSRYDRANIPTRAISLMWNQRSVDTFLGLPFNIASYALLLEILAKEVNMVPDELIGNLGDVHLYSNHIEQAKEQIGRELTIEERMDWWFKNCKPNRDVCDHVDELSPYAKGVYFDEAKVPKSTREPFELPTIKITERNWYIHEKVKEHLCEKTFSEKILSYRPDCFELINYISHPKIKASLSN